MKQQLMWTIIAAAGFGCSAAAPEWAGTVSDSAGIEIVANGGQGLWADNEAWTVEEVLRVGTVEADPDYQFGEIGWLAPGSDGRMYVLDNQAQQVKVFSPDGEYLFSMGSPGNGPGEIGQVQGGFSFVLVGPADTVLVPDNTNLRVSRWTSEGEYVGSFPLDFQQGIPFTWTIAPNGTIALHLRPVSFTGGEGGGDDLILLLDTDGTVRDTVTTFASGESISFSSAGVPTWKIFTPETTWSMSGTGDIHLGRSDEYRIKQFNASGELVRIVTMPWEQRPVTERDQRAVREFFRRMFRDIPQIPPNMVDPLVDNNVHFGEFLPAFARIVSGPDETIWIQHVRGAADMTDEELENIDFINEAGTAGWDVIDRDGRYLGVVTMPDRFAPRVFDGDRVYGVWRDDLDVQYAMVLRIVGMETD